MDLSSVLDYYKSKNINLKINQNKIIIKFDSNLESQNYLDSTHKNAILNYHKFDNESEKSISETVIVIDLKPFNEGFNCFINYNVLSEHGKIHDNKLKDFYIKSPDELIIKINSLLNL